MGHSSLGKEGGLLNAWTGLLQYFLVLEFSKLYVTHLPRIKSDHRPLKLSLFSKVHSPKGRSFRFLAGWIEHPSFPRMSGSMSTLHSKFTDQVKNWNKEVYGHIFTCKKLLSCKLEHIEIEQDKSSSEFLEQVEMDVREELENVLHHEEILWQQKACCDWLVLGDWNTKFFHFRALRRRNQNKITALKNSLGEWIMDDDYLKLEAVNFYSKLYGEHPRPRRDFPSVVFPCLKDEDFNILNRLVSNEEIKAALFDMSTLKAPESDVGSCGASVFSWVREVFEGKSIDLELNNTLIVLIPKTHNPVEFSQFRPISLCSVLYKLVMKALSSEQAGFVAGRNITDNIIIAQEVIHSMRGAQKTRKWMAIKINLEKAFDRVQWDFIEASLQAACIPVYLRNFIMSAISSSTMQVLWNGVPTQKFRPARGVRQGCPLSPYLFILCIEWLGYSIRNAIGVDIWILFSHADENQARVIKNILDDFCDYSGHRINSRKTNIFFSKVVDDNLGAYNHQFGLLPGSTSSSWQSHQQHFELCGVKGASKKSLVSWDSVCQPKSHGGLRLRQLKDHNTSFMMKVGFNIISNTNALWIQVLRSKYRVPSGLPDDLSRSRCSFLWRSISKVWPLSHENLIWSVKDGNSIKCWQDPWIPNCGSLFKIIPYPANLFLDCSLNSMVAGDGSWKLDLFKPWVPDEIINKITGVPPPHLSSGPD
ncbi:reverse transcriptase [Gossypium australe]|uniref:Reverse transcriptase n=1 Tax=Gossypium australe TaxID=47621 RepID=A0A5B6WIQ8_9ROSI|nr:reverse transcriptase [Gossypium australe]